MSPFANPEPLGAHVALEPQALAVGITVLRSAMDFGFTGPIDIPPDEFHPDLASTARITRNATESGARKYHEIVAHLLATTEPGPSQDLARAKLSEYGDGLFGVHPEKLESSAAIIRRYHSVKSQVHLVAKLQARIAAGDGYDDVISQLAALEAGGGDKGRVRERAYAMRFDPDETPPPDETCMVIGDVPIAARGNLTVPQGKSKVGKSALISAILGAAHRGNYNAQGDTLCVAWLGESTGAIIHLDTEQSRSDWHALVCRGITRSGIPEASPRLVSLPLVMFSRSERLAILKQTLAFEREAKGGIDIVVLDGVADLCVSPNDEAEALELVSQLHALAQEFHCPIVCVLHENPGTDQGKTRGHLGSELNRKAFANLRIDKDNETGISTIYGTDMRKRDIPREQGFCFAWDDAAKMHTFQGRAAGLKAAQRDEKAADESRNYWEPIFLHLAGKRENKTFPEISVNLAVQAERETNGKEKSTPVETMKKRLQKAESLGVLRKSARGEWSFVQSGKTGKEREK